MINLESKKLLFIGIGFYDYEKLIKDKLEQSGAKVSYFSSVSNMRMTNFLYRMGFKTLAMSSKNRRREKLISKTVENNDIIFVIKGQELNRNNFETLKKRNPNAQWILYMWDSLVRHTNTELLYEYFPSIYSFDRIDCVRDPRLKFRPLFFREYIEKTTNREYYMSFIGWAHSDRLNILRKLKNELKNADKNYFLKLYYGPFDYLVHKYIKKTLTDEDRDIVITKPLPYSVFKDILSKSIYVIDISHPSQSGLTMRTIETLAAGCKLLTTNKDINNYPQIAKHNFSMLDRENPHIPPITCEQSGDIVSLLDYFYVDNFLQEIFESVTN